MTLGEKPNGMYLFLVQHECIPQAILSMDVLCQAKSGMGKTAVFVLATLQQIEPVDGQVSLPSLQWSLSSSEDRLLVVYVIHQ